MSKIILPLLILFLYSCKKDKSHKESFAGIVLHTITNQPLTNQQVLLTVTTYKTGKKTDEFPDGTPIFTASKYYTTTDIAGKYNFDFEVDAEWIFSVQLVTHDHIQKIPARNLAFMFPGNSYSLVLAKQAYDTIYGERPGYVRYNVKNVNEVYNNDSLFASTYYQQKWIGKNTGSFFQPSEYNWVLTGPSVDRVIVDTIPAESEPQIPVKWLHKRADTVVFKNENIDLQPLTAVDYFIHY